MAIYTVVSTITGPDQILQGTITVEDGSTYIIDPGVTAAISFVAPAGSPTSVGYTIRIDAPNATGLPNDYPITLGDMTTPTVEIGAGVNAATYPFANNGVDGVHYQIGSGATASDLVLGDGDNGQINIISTGDNVTISGGVFPGAGDTQLLIGDNATFQQNVDFGFGSGQVSGSVGANAIFNGGFQAGGSGDKTISFGDHTAFNGGVNIFGDTVTVDAGVGTNFAQDVQIGAQSQSTDVTLNLGVDSSITGSVYVYGASVNVNAGSPVVIGGSASFGQSDGVTAVTVGDGFKVDGGLTVRGETIDFVGQGSIETGQAARFGDYQTQDLNVTIGADSTVNFLSLRGETMTFDGGPNLTVNYDADFWHTSGTSHISLGDGTTIMRDARFAESYDQNANVTIGNNVTVGQSVYLTAGAGGSANLTAGDTFTFGQMYGGQGNTTVTLGQGWVSTGHLLSFGTGNDTVTLPIVDNMAGPVTDVLGGETVGDSDVLHLVFNSAAEKQSFVDAALAAGWTLNPDGSLNSQDAAGNNLPLSWSNLYFSEWESAQVGIICFAAGTLIRAKEGETAIEALRPGSEVLTLDQGYQAIRWIGSRRLTAGDLTARPHLRPVRIRAGALGRKQPAQDLVVSPQHRILVRSRVAERMFGAEEVLVAAKHLLPLEGVEIVEDMAEVTYWHFLFDRHQVVYANGTASESLYTGPEALKAVDPAALAEILEILPELRAGVRHSPPPARQLVRGRLAWRLAERIMKNRKPLVM